MSTNSIEKGARWSPEIATRLNDTSQAIICVTSENQDAPWLNFEAGALAKATESRVRPILIDLKPSDVTGPLSEFQLTSASDKDDMRRLMAGINASCDRKLPPDLLDTTFDREWSHFDAKVKEVVRLLGTRAKAPQPSRSDSEILSEVLERVRMMERLGQEQIFMVQRLLEGPDSTLSDRETLLRRREAVFRRDAALRRDAARNDAVHQTASAETQPPTNRMSMKQLKSMHEDLRRMLGSKISIITVDDKELIGILDGIRGDDSEEWQVILTPPGSNGAVAINFSDVIDYDIAQPSD